MRWSESGRSNFDDVARAFLTRCVPPSAIKHLIRGDAAPRAGDLVLVKIEELGQQSRIGLPNGNRRNLFIGDEVILTYGSRYAPRMFEAIVPPSLEPCHLISASGLAGRALSWHEKVYRGPTEVTPLGLLADRAGRRINVADYALSPYGEIAPNGPVTIAVAGTAMNAGKTSAAAYLARGLVRAGRRVGFAKLTGTGAGGDPGLVRDAGADPVLDFTDAGYVSTYQVSQPEIERVVTTLVTHLQARTELDVILLELADGLLQGETASLLASDFFHTVVDGMIFCAGDAMGALAGVDRLRDLGYPVLAVGGLLTRAPLQVREATQAARVPVFSRIEFADPATALKLAEEALASRCSW